MEIYRIEIEAALNQAYHTKIDARETRNPLAGLGFGIAADVKWRVPEHPEQRKILDFDKDVFIVIPPAAPIFDELTTMLWIFAASPLFGERSKHGGVALMLMISESFRFSNNLEHP